MTVATGTTSITLTHAGHTRPVSVLSPNTGEVVFLESKDLDLDDDKNEKYVDGVQFVITDRPQLGFLEAYFAPRRRHEDPLIWDGPYSLAGADGFVSPRFSARYVKVKVVDGTPTVRWKFSQLNFFGSKFSSQSGKGPRGRR
jgi:hypothetical protein